MIKSLCRHLQVFLAPWLPTLMPLGGMRTTLRWLRFAEAYETLSCFVITLCVYCCLFHRCWRPLPMAWSLASLRRWRSSLPSMSKWPLTIDSPNTQIQNRTRRRLALLLTIWKTMRYEAGVLCWIAFHEIAVCRKLSIYLHRRQALHIDIFLYRNSAKGSLAVSWLQNNSYSFLLESWLMKV